MGRRFDVEVGAFAHGGHCVARLPADVPEVGGTVVFVRHALPGELATVEITEGSAGDRFLRGDAVAVSRTSADRVTPPCPFAGPGRCGGCDLQHVALDAQRRLKAGVVEEQLRRIAGVDLRVTVEAVPGDEGGLRWRTRLRLHRGPDGALGLRAHRSHRVVPVDDCRIAAPGALVVVDGEDGDVRGEPVLEEPVLEEPVLEEPVGDHRFAVAGHGFWQVHRGAAPALVGAVLDAAGPRPGERVADLYAGVGLFAAFLADAVGPAGEVHAVEGDAGAAGLAVANLAAYPWVRVTRGAVERVLSDAPREPLDVVVLDPPRAGARRPVVEAVAARSPRVVVHVACDPAAFARDAALLAEHGYALTGLRALDLFPMTHHVEVVGRFAPESAR